MGLFRKFKMASKSKMTAILPENIMPLWAVIIIWRNINTSGKKKKDQRGLQTYEKYKE